MVVFAEEVLEQVSHKEHVHLTNVAHAGIVALAENLRTNENLKSLVIAQTSISNSVSLLAEALKTNTTLDALYITGCYIGPDAAQTIAEALQSNTTLTRLALGYNYIGAKGASALAKLLASNTSLSWLNLWSNNMGDEGVAALADALKANNTLTGIILNENNIWSAGATALAESLRTNAALVSLDLEGNRIDDAGAKTLIEAISTNPKFVRLNLARNRLSPEATHGLAEIVISGGSKNIIECSGVPELDSYCSENKLAAQNLLKKITAGDHLSVDDIEEIRARKSAIVYLGTKEGNDESKGAFKEKFSAIEEILEAPSDTELQNNHHIDYQTLLPTLNSIANRYSISIKELLGSNPPKPFTLDDIEVMLAASQAQPNQPASELSNVTRARMELVNNVIIPHIDYFIISALRAEENAEAVDFASYPNIQRVAGTQYDLSKFKQQARSRQSAEGGLKFGYLHDESQGDHMTRLHRALKEVDGTIGEHEATFKRIEAEIADIYLKIDQNRGLADEKGKYLADAKKGNEFRTDRIHEYSIRANSARLSAEVRNQERAKATFGQTLSYWLAKGTQGIPILEGITEAVAEHVGHPNFGNNRALIRATSAAAKVDAEAAEAIIEYYQGKQIDTDAIEREIKIVRAGINKMQQDQGFKRLEQDKTKQKAIAEAFVNKLMLNFGQHMSENLLAVCEEHSIEHVDDFFAAFKGDPRLHEAFTNLCFGYADSNDLSVIFAEVAGMKGDEPAQAAAREYVERVLKPNIDDLYAHASKVDLIYQANLSGLGTDLHNARHMIRSEHDMRVRALFGDSFGVDSQMGALTVRGAVDVKNLFDYYMHRHGKTTLTDTKIHDGLVTGNKAPKRVSLLDDTAMVEHKELAKASRGYRQDGPDVSDMFLRICGYEYFVPQAPNDAQRSNIMANNPEAPASYQMANRVVKEFIQKLSFAHIDDYRAKVGTTDKTPSKLDNLMAQTFMDFFSEVGAIHAADAKLGGKRADLKAASKETGTFGFAFDSYERLITKDSLGRFDLFLEIYKRNLEVQLRDASVEDGKLLRDQIAAVAELTQHQLNPNVVEPGSEQDRHQARLANHTFANTHWRGVA